MNPHEWSANLVDGAELLELWAEDGPDGLAAGCCRNCAGTVGCGSCTACAGGTASCVACINTVGSGSCRC